MKKIFNFVSALTLTELADRYELPYITFYGASGYYICFNGIYYICWDGTHVATKIGHGQPIYNPNAKLPRGFKKCVNEITSPDVILINSPAKNI